MASADVCAVCQEKYNEKKDNRKILLTCLHPVCQQCFNDYKSLEQHKQKCTFCEEGFDLNTVYIVPSKAGDDDLNCDECETQTAAMYRCTTCSEHYCSVHANAHRSSKKSNLHIVSPLNIIHNLCRIHLANEVCFFCEQCNVVVCSRCVTGPHKSHPLATLEEATIHNQLLIQEELTHLSKRVSQIDNATESLRSTKQDLQQKLTEILASIDLRFGLAIEKVSAKRSLKKLCKQIVARRDQLKAQATKLIMADIKTIDLHFQGLETSKELMLLIKCNANTKQQQPVNILHLQDLLLKRNKILLQSELALDCLIQHTLQFFFHEPKDLLSANISLMGKISTSKFDRDWQSITKPSIIQFGFHPRGLVELHDGSIFFATQTTFVTTSNQGTIMDRQQACHYVNFTALSPDGEHLLLSSQMGICFITLKDSTHVNAIPFDELLGVDISTNKLIVAACVDDKVRAFSEDGELKWISSSKFFGLRGVTFLNEQELIVCDYGNSRLHVLSAMDGHCIRMIGVGKLRSPNDVALIPDTNAIAILQNMDVVIMTLEGEVLAEIGTQGSNPGEIKTGTYGSIAVLKDGRIAITENENIAITENENNRIQIF